MSLIRSFKNSISSKLTKRQTRFLRNIVEPPFLYSFLSKDSVLILGCQRSGTTLTYLIFNSHPQVKGIDETETGYAFPHQSILYRNSIKNYLTCLKLFNQTANFEYIAQHFPQTKIIAPIRNPYRVVASMRAFKTKTKTHSGNWLNCFAKDELLDMSSFFSEIESLDVDNLDEISLGAYVWKYKKMLIDQYQQAGFNVLTFKYENLLDNPRKTITKILNFTGLEWDDILLNHQKYYDGVDKRYPGGTRSDRPVEAANKKRQLNLAKSEIELITLICQDRMAACGYDNLAV